MTEAEWLAGEDPGKMLQFLQDRVSERKLRLFALATAVRLFALFNDSPSPKTLAAIEECADSGILDDSEGMPIAITSPMTGVYYGRSKPDHPPFVTIGSMVRPETVIALIEALKLFNDIRAECYGVMFEVAAEHGRLVEFSQPLVRVLLTPVFVPEDYRHHGLRALREVFGNPFRPATLDPAWRTSTVLTLASQMYESRDFSAMPILADALQDAGCDSEEVLNHCRDAHATHVRGCWVVDLVLGKS